MQRPPGGDLNREVHRQQPQEPVDSQQVVAKRDVEKPEDIVMQIKMPGKDLIRKYA